MQSPSVIRAEYPNLLSLAADLEEMSRRFDALVQQLATQAPKVTITFSGTTGSGTPLFGTNCPAVDPSSPFTWISATLQDGSIVYVPAWK